MIRVLGFVGRDVCTCRLAKDTIFFWTTMCFYRVTNQSRNLSGVILWISVETKTRFYMPYQKKIDKVLYGFIIDLKSILCLGLLDETL